MKAIITALVLISLYGCGPQDRHFWYPVELMNAQCGAFEGDVYRMTNSVGWRSYPYFLEVSTKREITLNQACVFRSIRKLPVFKRDIEKSLTDEQRSHLINGFN